MFEKPRNLYEKSQEFIDAVKRSKGKVVVLVHPLYLIYSGATNYRDTEKYTRVLQGLDKNAKPPIIVLEEEENIIHTSSAFRRFNSKPFFVGTNGVADPTEGWEKLHKNLRTAGVKSVLIGGMFSILNDRLAKKFHQKVIEYERRQTRPPKQTIVLGCVGNTYTNMIEAGHPIVRLIPNLLFPDKPCHAERPKISVINRILQRIRSLR